MVDQSLFFFGTMMKMGVPSDEGTISVASHQGR